MAAVWRLAEKGNIVQFGPEDNHNFIKDIQTAKKIPFHNKGKSYVMKVESVEWVLKKAALFHRQAK